MLADLRSLGYVDDTALACSLAERRLSSGWGAHRVRADLERLEIEGDSARAGLALAEAGSGRRPRTCSRAARRGADARRVAALLVRRGFSDETVEALVVADFDGRPLARARARAVGYGSYFRIICRQTAALAANFREHRAAFVVSAALGDRPVPRERLPVLADVSLRRRTDVRLARRPVRRIRRHTMEVVIGVVVGLVLGAVAGYLIARGAFARQATADTAAAKRLLEDAPP